MTGTASSLNAANAASVVFYEARRQRPPESADEQAVRGAGLAGHRPGEISLRRRLEPICRWTSTRGRLGDEFLMSSLFPVAEIELARPASPPARATSSTSSSAGWSGLHRRDGTPDPRVRSLAVVEALAPVIGWHEPSAAPDVAGLTDDLDPPRARRLLRPRCWHDRLRRGHPGPPPRRAARHRPHPGPRAAPRKPRRFAGGLRAPPPSHPGEDLRALVGRPAG